MAPGFAPTPKADSRPQPLIPAVRLAAVTDWKAAHLVAIGLLLDGVPPGERYVSRPLRQRRCDQVVDLGLREQSEGGPRQQVTQWVLDSREDVVVLNGAIPVRL